MFAILSTGQLEFGQIYQERLTSVVLAHNRNYVLLTRLTRWKAHYCNYVDIVTSRLHFW